MSQTTSGFSTNGGLQRLSDAELIALGDAECVNDEASFETNDPAALVAWLRGEEIAS